VTQLTEEDETADQFEDSGEETSRDDDSEVQGDDEEMVEVSSQKLDELRNERDELEDKYLRKVADFDNLKKRVREEKQEFKKYAHTEVLADLLEIQDNFERALESMEIENEDVREGVGMIQSQLNDLLKKYDVEPIEAEGKRFDPHKHEGMMREEREDVDKQTVAEVFKKGYKLHDRVLRPASVKVAVPANTDDEHSENEES